MKHGHNLLLAVLATIALAGAHEADARMFRWIDESGRVYYSDAIPPQYARRGDGHKIYDHDGRLMSIVEAAKSGEELAMVQQQAAIVAEQTRRDRILLATFTTEDDLQYVRDERVETLDSALMIARQKLIELNQQLVDLEGQAAAYEAKQAPLSERLAARLDNVRERIGETEEHLDAAQEQKQTIKAAFAADLERYRELRAAR